MKIREIIAAGQKSFHAVCHELKKHETNDSALFKFVTDELGCYLQFDSDVEDLNGMKLFTQGKKYSVNYSRLDWDVELIPDKYLEE